MKRRSVAVLVASSIVVQTAGLASAQAQSSALPAVKLSASNKMPECATPGRMMAYLAERNPKLDPRYAGIATFYMRHGEEIGVRWDYAFFQMMLETASLAYKRGNGKPGDVKPAQNNFAGLGATGNGAPGETFNSISDGVKAHLQHLAMYTGEQVAEPIADRTRKVQEWGVLTSWQKSYKRPITFADLAAKWAPGSRGYVGDVKSIAAGFYDDHCAKADPKPQLVAEARSGMTKQTKAPVAERSPGRVLAQKALERGREEGDGTRKSLGATSIAAPQSTAAGVKVLNEPTPDAQAAETAEATTKPATVQTASAAAAAKTTPSRAAGGTVGSAAVAALTPKAPAAGAGATPQTPAQAAKCRVWTASYGGQKAVIIRSASDQFTNFTVLDVNEGQEAREVEAYISAYAKGGQKVGDFSTQNAALDKAFQLCPEG